MTTKSNKNKKEIRKLSDEVTKTEANVSSKGRNRRKKRTKQEIRIMAMIAAAFVLLAGWSYLFDVDFNVSLNERFANSSSENNPVTRDESQSSDQAERLASIVVPEQGYTVNIKWGDTGKKLVATGGVDMNKYQNNYVGEQYEELLSYLTEDKDEGITINRENAYFWVNTLWALGLTQKSDVLDKGVMGTEYKDRVGNFASIGGWTLGSKDAVSLYSSSNIIPLTQQQQDLVFRASENIYRPCCGNPTSFPDCNHGMAILGLLELMASQGFSEQKMYEASLAFNSYWFTQTYIDLAHYFETKEGTTWDKVDAKKVLSAEFSSAPGYQAIKQQVGNAPKLQSSGGSCGA